MVRREGAVPQGRMLCSNFLGGYAYAIATWSCEASVDRWSEHR